MSFVDIGNAQLILGDCTEGDLNFDPACVLVTDPPYGHGYKVNARTRSNEGLKTDKVMTMPAKNRIAGYDAPLVPLHLLGFKKAAIFGGNHFDGLPAGGRWIVWDKRRDSKPDDHSDCEMVWTNIRGADRIHRQKWRGIVREGEENLSIGGKKLHTSQKPVALIEFIFDQIGVEAGDIIVDPYMGSGSVGVVAMRRGLRFVGVEIDPEAYAIARVRLTTEFAKLGGAA